MKRKLCKITCAGMAIAIFWFFAYGFGSAAANCCNTVINTCSPSGIRSPFIPTVDTHCRPSPSHYSNRHKAAENDARLTFHDVNETTECCPKTPCKPIGFTAFSGQSPPPSPWMQAAGYPYITIFNHTNITLINSRYSINNQTVPIYLLTKTIIC